MPSRNRHIEVGDSFTVKNQYGFHLHVVVAEASPNNSAFIFLVYISSSDIPAKDTTTLIQAGEHPFIDRPSWVRYQNVLICARDEIERLIIDDYGKVSPELLDRIQGGVLDSERVNDPDKETFRQWKMEKAFRDLK